MRDEDYEHVFVLIDDTKSINRFVLIKKNQFNCKIPIILIKMENIVKKLKKVGKVNKSIIDNNKKKKNVVIPNLLLAHSYFLNDQHTSYITIGYNIETFKPVVILYKNTVFHELSTDAWTTIVFNNLEMIRNHFSYCENNIAELPKINGDCDVKLTCRNNERQILFTNGHKKIILNLEEWERVSTLSSFLQSYIIWSETNWQDVGSYYNLYALKCFNQKTFSLEMKDFFIPPVIGYNYFNYSRLFNEIPILCKNKIINDYYSNIVNQNLIQ